MSLAWRRRLYALLAGLLVAKPHSMRDLLGVILISVLSTTTFALESAKVDLKLVLQHAQAAAIKAGKPKTFEIANLAALHPTQPDLGMFEVAFKTKGLVSYSPEKFQAYLETRVIPVARGPDGNLYIIDHHHFSRTVLDLGMTQAVVEVWGDFSKLEDMNQFWEKMTSLKWAFLFDQNGRALTPSQLPKSLKDMGNNFYRSLAYAVRLSGGFIETEVPFGEFWWGRLFQKLMPLSDLQWQDLFSRLLKVSDSKDFLSEPLIAEAHKIAHSPEAKELPGYLSDECAASLDIPAGHL